MKCGRRLQATRYSNIPPISTSSQSVEEQNRRRHSGSEIRVSLVQSLRLPPNRSAMVPVKLEGTSQLLSRTIIVEGEERVEKETGIIVEDAVVSAPKDGLTHVVVSNLTGFTQTVPEGTFLCGAQIADVVTPDPEPESATEDAANVKKLSSPQEEWRRRKLLEIVQLQDVPQDDARQLQVFLADNHDVFSLEEGERGETDLITMGIDTGRCSAMEASTTTDALCRSPRGGQAAQEHAAGQCHSAIVFTMV